MAKIVDYVCENCEGVVEELFNDTEEQPKILDRVCPKCKGSLKRGLNFKSNCQVWSWNDRGSI